MVTNEEIDAETREERNQEDVRTHFDDWKSANLISLQEECFEMFKEGMPEGTTYRDVEEYYPEEFNEYCKSEYLRDL